MFHGKRLSMDRVCRRMFCHETCGERVVCKVDRSLKARRERASAPARVGSANELTAANKEPRALTARPGTSPRRRGGASPPLQAPVRLASLLDRARVPAWAWVAWRAPPPPLSLVGCEAW